MKLIVTSKAAHRRQCSCDSYQLFRPDQAGDWLRLCARRSCPHPLHRDGAGAGFILDTDEWPKSRDLKDLAARGEWPHLAVIGEPDQAQEVLW